MRSRIPGLEPALIGVIVLALAISPAIGLMGPSAPTSAVLPGAHRSTASGAVPAAPWAASAAKSVLPGVATPSSSDGPTSPLSRVLAATASLLRRGTPSANVPEASPVAQSWSQAVATAVSAASGLDGGAWTVTGGEGAAIPSSLTVPVDLFASQQVGCVYAPVGTPPVNITVPATPGTASAGTATFYEFYLNSTGVPNTELFAFVVDGVATLLATYTGASCAIGFEALYAFLGETLSLPALDSTTAASIANAAGGSAFLQSYPNSTRLWVPLPSTRQLSGGNVTSAPSEWLVEYGSACGATTGYQGATFAAGIEGVTGAVLTNGTSSGTCYPSDYPLTFTESGLPSGTAWTVGLDNGQVNTSTSSSVGFSVSNGTYTYTVALPAGYAPTPSSGSATIAGSGASVPISFHTASTYQVTFQESGLPTGMAWSVTWDSNLTFLSNTSSLSIETLNGAHTFLVDKDYTNSTGYSISPVNGTVSVSGANTTQSITFAADTLYPLTIQETGLATGTGWGVEVFSLSGLPPRTVTSTSSQFTLSVANGSYELFGGVESAYYNLSVPVQALSVAGAPATATFAFHPHAAYLVQFNEVGLAAASAWYADANYEINSTTGTRVSFLLWNGTYAFTAGGAPGYSASPSSGTLTVSGAAQSITITFSGTTPLPTYAVTFSQTTLPSGAPWAVTIAGTTHTSTGASVVFDLANGSYAFNVTAPTGFRAAPSNGSVTVNGAPRTVSIAFAPTYTVTFTESGLPSGTNWSVTLNTTARSSTSTSIAFAEVSGHYPFSVAPVAGYTAAPVAGTVTVSGAPVTETIAFTPLPPGQYGVVFVESGLPTGTNWSVTFSGQTRSTTSGAVSFQAANGTHPYVVGTVIGFAPTPPSGTVTINGASTSVAISFRTAPTYSVTFVEAGLPAGSNWSIAFNGGSPQSGAAGAAIVFTASNGTFDFTVGAVSGYTSNITSGKVHVLGGPQTVNVRFSASSSGPSSSTFLGLPAWEGYTLIGVIALIVVVGVVLAVLRGRRRTGGSPPTGTMPAQGAAPPPSSPPSGKP